MTTAPLALSDAHARQLEEQRKIPVEIAAEAGVVSKGNLIGFRYTRAGTPAFVKFRGPEKSFFIEPKGATLFLWNADCLTEQSDAAVVITEGEFDALSLLAAGVGRVVSVPNGAPPARGKGPIDPEADRQFSYLWDDEGRLRPELAAVKRFVLATDGDKPGRILRDELAIRLGRTRCDYVEYPQGCKDASDVLQKFGADRGCEMLRDMIEDAKPIVPSRLVRFDEIPRTDYGPGLSTGWGCLDPHFRVVEGQLVVVTGVPNAGKSEWTMSLVANLARVHGLRGAILQLEDNVERNRHLLNTYAATWAKDTVREPRLDPAAFVREMFLTVSPLEDLDDDTDRTLKYLEESIVDAARRGCKWVLIDPWNELDHFWERQETEAAYLNRAIRRIKRLARANGLTIIIVAHPTAAAASKATLDDLDLKGIAGGAVWNNKADIGLVVWADDTADAVRTIKISKSKDWDRMGRPGRVRLKFDPRKRTFVRAD